MARKVNFYNAESFLLIPQIQKGRNSNFLLTAVKYFHFGQTIGIFALR